MLKSTLEMRIRIHVTIVLSLMTIVIATCVGPSAGLPRHYQANGAPDWDVSWRPGRYYTSERRDQKGWRDEPLPETRYTPDPRILFKQLDDLERMEDKPKIPGQIPAAGWAKSWPHPGGFQAEPIIRSDLRLDDSFPQPGGFQAEPDLRLDDSFPQPGGFQVEPVIRSDLRLDDSFPHPGDYQAEPVIRSDLRLDDSFPHNPIESTDQHEFLDPPDYMELGNMNENEKANEHAAGLQESNRKMAYYWGKHRDEAPKLKEPYCPLWPDSPSFPISHPLTSDSRSPTFCQSDYPDTIQQTDPPRTPTEPTESPDTSEPTHSKCRKNSRILSPEAAKELLDIIMDTKQHVLSTLKILNHMENEVLGYSDDDDYPLQGPEQECALRFRVRPVPKKMPERLEKPLKYPTWKQPMDFSFGKLPPSQRKSVSALAQGEKLKHQGRVWAEHHDFNPARRLIIRNRSWNHRYPGYKEHPKLKRVPPGFVAILV